MPDINITVAHKVAVSDTQSIVCDNSDYTVHWTLDEEWSAYDTKTMRTIYMDGTFKDTVFSGDTIELPVCTVPGAVQIGLFAGDIRTSRVAILRALPSVRSAAGAPADPAPDVYDQLMDLIKGLGGADPEAIKTAVAEYLTEHPIEETDPTVPAWAKAEITGATPGQIAKITAVDEIGKPTAWEPVEMAGGGEELTWHEVIDYEATEETNDLRISTDKSGREISGYHAIAMVLYIIVPADSTQSSGNGSIFIYPFAYNDLGSTLRNIETISGWKTNQRIYNYFYAGNNHAMFVSDAHTASTIIGPAAVLDGVRLYVRAAGDHLPVGTKVRCLVLSKGWEA